MFEYTTENIINDNKGRLKSGKRFELTDGIVYIDGVGRFDLKNVSEVYKSDYDAEASEIVKITIPTTGVAAGDVLRLVVKTRQEGLTSSIYADTQLRHIKSFFYEIKVKDASALASEFSAIISKEMSMTDFDFFKASVETSGQTSKLVLTADDVYTRFVEIEIVKRVEGECPECAVVYGLTGNEKGQLLLGWERKDGTVENKVDLTPGKEGNGTVRRIIKNLRLPTLANIDPFGLDFGGKPIPGGEYNIYTVLYCTDRHNVGHDVMGSVGKSITTHIFYVERNNADSQSAFGNLWANYGPNANGTIGGKTISGTANDAKTPDHSQVG